ncbi:unnamed protein product [Prunus armeniaca]
MDVLFVGFQGVIRHIGKLALVQRHNPDQCGVANSRNGTNKRHSMQWSSSWAAEKESKLRLDFTVHVGPHTIWKNIFAVDPQRTIRAAHVPPDRYRIGNKAKNCASFSTEQIEEKDCMV